MKLFYTKHKGQMLLEIVVAIGIIGLVLVGVSDLMTRSTRVVTFQKQKDEALNIAQKLLSQYRYQRDSNPQLFYDSAASTVINPCVTGLIYICNVTMTKSASSVLINVRVDWTEGGQTYNVSLHQSLAKDQK